MFNQLKIEGTYVGIMGNEAINVGRAELLKTLYGLQRSTDYHEGNVAYPLFYF